MNPIIDFQSEINAITRTSAAKSKLCIQPTNINTQKNDGFTLGTYLMVIAGFSGLDKLSKIFFFG